MTLAIPSGTRVSLLYVGGATPLVASATANHVHEGVVELALDNPVQLPERARLILELPPGSPNPRVLVELIVQSGTRLVVRLALVPTRDTREYPRLEGRVELTYFVAAHAEDGLSWLAGGLAPGEERTPDPLMSFSAKGLAFDESRAAAEGELLLLSLRVPGEPRPWRATARVLRAHLLPADQREPGGPAHHTAVVFESLPAAAAESLAAYTARIQERLLGGEGAE